MRFINNNLNIQSMAFIYCKKCGELNYLTPHAFWNISDFGAKCEKCETINTITLEWENLKSKYSHWTHRLKKVNAFTTFFYLKVN